MVTYNYKMVIVTRQDLKLTRGKLAVQVAHAAVVCAIECRRKKPKWYTSWFREGQKKVVVSAANLAELQEILRKSERLGLTTSMITDAGLTEIPSGTVTCLGIGPAPDKEVNKITGTLPLL